MRTSDRGEARVSLRGNLIQEGAILAGKTKDGGQGCLGGNVHIYVIRIFSY